MKIAFFKSSSEFRTWLEENHDKAQELWIGFYKKVHPVKPAFSLKARYLTRILGDVMTQAPQGKGMNLASGPLYQSARRMGRLRCEYRKAG